MTQQERLLRNQQRQLDSQELEIRFQREVRLMYAIIRREGPGDTARKRYAINKLERLEDRAGESGVDAILSDQAM